MFTRITVTSHDRWGISNHQQLFVQRLDQANYNENIQISGPSWEEAMGQ